MPRELSPGHFPHIGLESMPASPTEEVGCVYAVRLSGSKVRNSVGRRGHSLGPGVREGGLKGQEPGVPCDIRFETTPLRNRKEPLRKMGGLWQASQG